MQIIIEGPDGSGKSTLIRALKEKTDWTVIEGGGPEKYPFEVKERLERYLKAALDTPSYPKIYDRHPAVSHPIYGPLSGKTEYPPTSYNWVYELPHICVYCQAPKADKLTNHEVGKYDTADHLTAISSNFSRITVAYDRWALTRAHIIHRYWEPDSVERTANAIIGAMPK